MAVAEAVEGGPREPLRLGDAAQVEGGVPEPALDLREAERLERRAAGGAPLLVERDGAAEEAERFGRGAGVERPLARLLEVLEGLFVGARSREVVDEQRVHARQLGRAGVARHDGGAGRGVEPAPIALADLAVDDLAQLVVGEAQPPTLADVEDLPPAQLVDGLEVPQIVQARRGREHAAIELAAQYGRHPRERARAVAEARDLPGHQIAEPAREGERVVRRALGTLGERELPDAGVVAVEHALVDGDPEVLGDEEGVALGPRDEEREERRWRRGHREHVAHHPLHRAGLEPSEIDARGPRRAEQGAELGAGLLGAVHAQEEHARLGEVGLVEGVEKAERALVGPLEVVEDQQHRLDLGEGRERAREALVEAGARGVRREHGDLGALSDTGQPAHRGLVDREDRAAVAEDVRRLGGALVTAVIGDRHEERLEGVERRGLHRARGGVGGRDGGALAGHHAEAVPPRDRRRLHGEARLAYAALAAHEGAPAAGRPHALEILLELRERGGAPGEAGPVEVGERLRRRAASLRAEPGQRRGHVVGIAEPILGLLLQELEDELVERRRHARDPRPGPLRERVQVLAEHRVNRSDEGRGARDALVEHAAERIEIDARIHELALDLLGRHVRRAAAATLARRDHLAAAGPAELQRQAEVGEHGGAAVAEEDVAGLGIAVDEAQAVDERERVADGRHHRQHAGEGAARRAGEAGPGDQRRRAPRRRLRAGAVGE